MNTLRKCFLGIMLIMIFVGSIRPVAAATERQREIQKIKDLITYWERFKSDEKLLVPIRVLLEMEPFADPGLTPKERTKKIIRTKCDNRYVRDPDTGTLFGPNPFDRFKKEYYGRRRREGATESQIDGEFQTILNKNFELIKYVREKALPRQRDKLSRLERTRSERPGDRGKERVWIGKKAQVVKDLKAYIEKCARLIWDHCQVHRKSTYGLPDVKRAWHRKAESIQNTDEADAVVRLVRKYVHCWTTKLPGPPKRNKEGKLLLPTELKQPTGQQRQDLELAGEARLGSDKEFHKCLKEAEGKFKEDRDKALEKGPDW